MEKVYGDEYLNRRPGPEELFDLHKFYEHFYFLGCVGSIDFMKLKWKNFPYHFNEKYHKSRGGNWRRLKLSSGLITTCTFGISSWEGAELTTTRLWFQCHLYFSRFYMVRTRSI